MILNNYIGQSFKRSNQTFMSYIIAGYHTLFESWQGGAKKQTIHKYIYISREWESILKFYRDGLKQCANYFFYYIVDLNKLFDLRVPTESFQVNNAHQMPKSLATHHFSEIIDNLKKPNQLNKLLTDPIGSVYFYVNTETHEAFLSTQQPQIFLKKYDENKQQVFLNTLNEFKNACHEMVTHQDFYIIQNIVRRHTQLIERLDFKDYKFELNKTICLNQQIGFDQF